MGDAGPERAIGRALRIDMYPLLITGRFGEQVDPLLGQLQPVGDAEVQALGLEHLFGTAESDTHELFLKPVVS